MGLVQIRVWILLLCATALTACQLAPLQKEQPREDIVIKDTTEEKIFQQLRSEQTLDRIEALRLLAKQPRLARKSISLILALLADDRQVDVARYVGSGFYDASVSSPAAMAAELLAKLGRWSVLPLRLRLNDPNPVVRRYAIKSLGIIANPEHAEWLLAALADSEAAVSKEAYAALLKQDPQVYVKLIDKLNMSRLSLRQRLLLIQLLGNSHHGDALAVLFKFSNDKNPVLRSASFVALAKFPEAKLQKIVLQGIKDNDMQVRENALMLAPHHKNAEILAAVFAQLTVNDANVRNTAHDMLPILTSEPQRSIAAWQQWWQTRNLKQ